MLAAWVLYPVTSGENADPTYDYTLDATGYHWSAEFGEAGQPKTYESGRRFRLTYDPAMENRHEDPGPDLQAQYDRMLAAKQQEYDRRAPNQVDFSIVEFGDGTFELAAQPVTPPVPIQPPYPRDIPTFIDDGEDTTRVPIQPIQPIGPHDIPVFILGPTDGTTPAPIQPIFFPPDMPTFIDLGEGGTPVSGDDVMPTQSIWLAGPRQFIGGPLTLLPVRPITFEPAIQRLAPSVDDVLIDGGEDVLRAL